MARLTRSNAKIRFVEAIRLQGGIVGFARRPAWILRGSKYTDCACPFGETIHMHAINARLSHFMRLNSGKRPDI